MSERLAPAPTDEYDIGELGPPLDMDDYPLTPDDETNNQQEAISQLPETITPRAPEWLNGQPFRYRQRVIMAIQNVDGRPVVMPQAELDKALADYDLPLFAEQLRGDEGLFWEHFRPVSHSGQRFLPYVEGQEIAWPEPDEPQTELSFIINHLPATDRDRVTLAIAEGKRVTVNLVWGPKDKITRFNQKKIAHYQYPQPPAEERERAINQERGFWGTNYLAFTKVRVEYNPTGDVRIVEELLAEANIGSKTGSYVQKDRWGNVVSAVDRTLPGLIRRNLDGDPYLPEEQRLYNQCADLADKIPTEDKLWVRKHFIEWVKQHLKKEYKVNHRRPQLAFRRNHKGELVTDEDTSYNQHIDHPHALRVNVNRHGYLAHVLMDLSERAHAEKRLEKYKTFQENYPVFRQIFVEQGPEGLAKAIMCHEAVAKRVLRKNREGIPNNLAYLAYCFAADADLPDEPLFTAGLGTAEAIMSALKTENDRLLARHSARGQKLTERDWPVALAKVREMLHPRYFSLRSDASWLGELLVSTPKLFFYPHAKRPRPKYAGQTFKRAIKPAPRPADHSQRSKNLWAFDIYPPEKTIAEHRDKLARLFIEYVSQINREGMLPNTYALHRDRNPRMIQGQEVDGNYFYNRARVLWRDLNTQEGQSSQYAIKRLFKCAQELLKDCVTEKEEQKRLEQLLDYEQMSQISEDLKHVTGKMGEVFTLMAIKTDLAALLNIGELPDRLKWSLEFVDMDHRIGEGKKMIEFLNKDTGQKEDVVPDFVINLRDQMTGELVRFLIDSKAYLKPITKDTAENIVEHYQPLLSSGRRLIIVSHSPLSTINQSAIEVFTGSGIILCSGEDVARVLDRADPAKYRVPPDANGSRLGEYYNGFSRHPGGFAAHEAEGSFINQTYLNIYRRILRSEDAPKLFRDADLYYQTDLT